jgi:hypothetical protein
MLEGQTVSVLFSGLLQNDLLALRQLLKQTPALRGR